MITRKQILKELHTIFSKEVKVGPVRRAEIIQFDQLQDLASSCVEDIHYKGIELDTQVVVWRYNGASYKDASLIELFSRTENPKLAVSTTSMFTADVLLLLSDEDIRVVSVSW